MIVRPGRRADVSMDISPICFSREPIDVTISPSISAEMYFPVTGNVESNFDGLRPADGSEGCRGDSFDARDREPLGGIPRVEELDCNQGGNLDENSGWPYQRETGISPETFKLSWSLFRRHPER